MEQFFNLGCICQVFKYCLFSFSAVPGSQDVSLLLPLLLLRRHHLQPLPTPQLNNTPAHWAAPAPNKPRSDWPLSPPCLSPSPLWPSSSAPLLVRDLPRWAAAGAPPAAEGRAAASLPSPPHEGKRNGTCPEPSWLAALPVADGPSADFRFQVTAAV